MGNDVSSDEPFYDDGDYDDGDYSNTMYTGDSYNPLKSVSVQDVYSLNPLERDAVVNDMSFSDMGVARFTPREVPSQELQSISLGWTRLRNPIPAYVQARGLGVCVVDYCRYIKNGDVWFYALYPLHPLNPKKDKVIRKRLEVPYQYQGIKLIFHMKLAISQFWPYQNIVVCITDEGTTYSIEYNNILYIADDKVKLALSALMKDFPAELTSALSFRTSSAPEFEMIDDDNSPDTSQFSTLSNSKESKEFFLQSKAMLEKSKRSPNVRGNFAPTPVMISNTRNSTIQSPQNSPLSGRGLNQTNEGGSFAAPTNTQVSPTSSMGSGNETYIQETTTTTKKKLNRYPTNDNNPSQPSSLENNMAPPIIPDISSKENTLT